MSRRKAVASSAIAVMAALVLSGTRAQAQVAKPFKIKGHGIATTGLPLPGEAPREHWSVGEATHLGRYFGDGTVETFTAVPDFSKGIIAGDFGGGSPYVFDGQGGNRLVTWYGRTDHGASEPGTFTLDILGMLPDGSLIVQAHFIAEFVAQPDESTGTFAGVTGSWIMYADSDPFILGSSDPTPYSWEGEGELTFRRGHGDD
ncbi:MAG TPA: hypothetical protein VG406_19350 [Isosphaeraceae bacterium]|nr:hypothetical protein [Isosphaeraceae bacterium]